MDEEIRNNDLDSDLFSGQVERKINCFMKQPLKIPIKMTVTPEGSSRNLEVKFTRYLY